LHLIGLIEEEFALLAAPFDRAFLVHMAASRQKHAQDANVARFGSERYEGRARDGPIRAIHL
jgi:hypothetical protein